MSALAKIQARWCRPGHGTRNFADVAHYAHSDIVWLVEHIADLYDRDAERVMDLDHAREETRAETIAAVVAYLRASANAEHPIERGTPALSPAGRGLLLLHADRIERGDHRREGEP